MARARNAVSFAQVFQHVKSFQFDRRWIDAVCRSVGHRWRDRVLNPTNTLQLFLLQILHANTAINHLRHLTPLDFTDSSYCEARMRLPLEIFRIVLRRIVKRLLGATRDVARWHGLRTFIIDGSSFSMPDTPELLEHFGQPTGQKAGCGFPVAHLFAMVDLATGFIVDVIGSPLYASELKVASKTHEGLQPGDLLLADRLFGGWGYLALVVQHQLNIVARANQRLLIDFGRRARWHPNGVLCRAWRNGPDDIAIEWFKPRRRPRWMSRALFDSLPPTIILRAVRRTINRRGFRTHEVILLTTLIDPEEYPLEEIVELYRRRWEIETGFRTLKRTMRMRELHCKTVDGVLKEMFMYAIAYNLVRLTMLEWGVRMGVSPREVSFVDALRWLISSIEHLSHAASVAAPTVVVNPHRPDRIEPRMAKRRPDQKRYLMRPREEVRQLIASGQHTP